MSVLLLISHATYSPTILFLNSELSASVDGKKCITVHSVTYSKQ